MPTYALSADIAGFDYGRFGEIAREASCGGIEALIRTGVCSTELWSTGGRGAQYATQILIASLCEAGALREDVDPENVLEAMKKVLRESRIVIDELPNQEEGLF